MKLNCRLAAMFAHQRSLAFEYLKIEVQKEPSTHTAIPVELHKYHGQQRLRGFAWHIIEEMSEANKEVDNMLEIYSNTETTDPEALRFEMVDVILFTLEFAILCGITPEQLVTRSQAGNPHTDDFDGDGLEILCYGMGSDLDHPDEIEPARFGSQQFELLGQAMNLLKNRPWTQKRKDTDYKEFKRLATEAVLEIFYHVGEVLGHETLAYYYERKCQVVLERIKDGY